jgi:polysaccharide pyruvyl transferase WcaK-like protein
MEIEVGTTARTVSAKRSVLVIASSGWWGSVGDDALLRTTCATLSEAGNKTYVLVNHDIEKWQEALEVCSATVLGPRQFLTPTHLMTALRLDAVYVIGADIMDGGFDIIAVKRRLFLASLFRLLGKKVSIINFSFNRQPKPEVLSGFQKLGAKVRYTARDRRSLARFELATGLRATPVADVGFLTRPEHSPRVNTFALWANEMRTEGRTLLMINTAIVPFRSNPATSSATPDDIARALQEALVNLDGREGINLAIAVAPHDFRFTNNPESDVSLATTLHERLQAHFGDRLCIVPTPFNSAEICAMATHVDMVVTGRMHLEILSLTAGVVPVSFTYQDKFEGMYEHVFAQSGNLMLSTQTLMETPSAIADALMAILDQQQNLHVEIAAARPRVIEAARKNFVA